MSVWTTQKILRRARATDIAAIMEIERQPGYEHLVGRWTEEQHIRNISTPGFLYLVHDGGEPAPVGFVALSGMGGQNGDVFINRLIVRAAGRGNGRLVLGETMSLAFAGAPTSTLWLRVRPENERALHLYRSEGFTDVEVLPHAGTTPDGRRVNLLLMAIDYDSWASRNAA